MRVSTGGCECRRVHVSASVGVDGVHVSASESTCECKVNVSVGACI